MLKKLSVTFVQEYGLKELKIPYVSRLQTFHRWQKAVASKRIKFSVLLICVFAQKEHMPNFLETKFELHSFLLV